MMFVLILYLSEDRMDFLVYGLFEDYEAAEDYFNRRLHHTYPQATDYVIITMMEGK
jgi:hypothetical protein